MKVIIGLVLVALTAALPVPHHHDEPSKEAPTVPLVIADYSSVAKSEEQHLHHQHHHDDALPAPASSEESSERPPAPTEAAPAKKIEQPAPTSSEESSESGSKEEKPLLDEVAPLAAPSSTAQPLPPPLAVQPLPLPIDQPKLEEKRAEKKDEPAAVLKEETPLVKKAEEPLPVPQALPAAVPAEAKKDELIVPAVKSIDTPELVPHQAKAGEAEKPEEKIVEKPLALPTLKAEETIVALEPAKLAEKLLEAPKAEEAAAPLALPSAEAKEIAVEKKAKADEVVAVPQILPISSTELPKIAIEGSSTLLPNVVATSTQLPPVAASLSPSS